MYVFRLHIRPKGGKANMDTTFQYCLKHKILGVGWGIHDDRVIRTKNWDEFYHEASQYYDNLRICTYIEKYVSEGDLIWTRDPDGHYYLARVKSGWEYWITEEAIEQDIDIANVVRCTIRPVELDYVPGKVVACFRAPKTIQEIANEEVAAYSRYLWNILYGEQFYEVDTSKFSDIFMMLDHEETEDLIFVYLQSQGWYVIPNSRKRDTMKFEFLVAHSKSGEKATIQVKTGNSPIDVDAYGHLSNKVFLFQSNGYYKNKNFTDDNIVYVSREKLKRFLESNIKLFPSSFKTKLEIVQQ